MAFIAEQVDCMVFAVFVQRQTGKQCPVESQEFSEFI
jgi:hypothetical protein